MKNSVRKLRAIAMAIRLYEIEVEIAQMQVKKAIEIRKPFNPEPLVFELHSRKQIEDYPISIKDFPRNKYFDKPRFNHKSK